MSRSKPPAIAKPTAPVPAPLPREDGLYDDFAELSRKVVKTPLILFFGRGTFSDNTKYLFLATTKAAIGCEVIWCTFSKPLALELQAHGFRAVDLAADTRQSCNLLLHAAAAVFCENPAAALMLNPIFSGCLAGAQKLQLWHGISVKQLDLMLVRHLDVREAEFRRQIRFATRIDHFLSPSGALDGFWVRAFGCTSLVRAGFPRNEVIVRPATSDEMLGSELPPPQAELLRAGRKRKFLVTPTWQRAAPLYIATSPFYERLAKWLAANNGVAFVKLHPFLSRTALPADIPGTLYFLGAGVDVYPWMSCFDAMVTDYSSIMFDYLLLNRPIFTFRAETQVAWGFEPDYALIPDGAFRYPFAADDFEAVVTNNLADHPLQAEQRKLSAALFETPPGRACADLVQFLSATVQGTADKAFTVTTPKVQPELRAAV